MNSRAARTTLIALTATLRLLSASPASAAEHYFFVNQWGSAGSAPGSFTYPFGIAVDKSYNVYVSDAGNNRIQKFSSAGALLGYWGTLGAGSGQLNFPEGIAVDASNNVYVTDTNNHRIEKFSASGAYLTAWGQHGSANGYFDYPTGVAADAFGYVYTSEPLVLSDSSNYRVQKFTSSGSFVTKWRGVTSPQDIAIDADGALFVLDDNSVVKYTVYGTPLGQWGSYGTGPGQLDSPTGLCVDSKGNVYVADTYNHRIQMFTGTGTFLAQWGSYGTGAGQFKYPADVAVDDSGNVYVSDQLNQRIQKFRRAPKVLLVHGICGSADSWDPFAQVLTDSGYVVERMQYGNPDYSLRPASYVNSMAAVIDTMGPGPIAVVAHSMGGLITRDYIRRQLASGRPNKISQLVTLGTPHHGADVVARLFSWGSVVDKALGPFFGPCQSSPYSIPALLDMLPGAAYLNLLNYGANATLFDVPFLVVHGWDAHVPETSLPASVYLASIGGTGSFCDAIVRGIAWPRGAAYRPNDCTVATGSSLLSNSGTFRASDPTLSLEKPVTHTNNALTTPCGEAYYSFGSLAQRVATILRTSPPASFESHSNGPTVPGLAHVQATVEDSIQMAPAISDSIAPGQVISRNFTLPATSLARTTLLSTNAHISLIDPHGRSITVADTSAAGGISFFSTTDPGFDGFEITGPLSGTWTMRIDGSTSATAQGVAGIVEYSSANIVRLSVLVSPIHPGDPMRVRGQLAGGGALKTGLTWTCNVLQPNGASIPLSLYDDGGHADSLAGDGIYGNALIPAGGVGQYSLMASVSAPGIEPLAAVAYCEVADVQDLAVATGDIQLSTNIPQAGTPMTVYATVHNNSSKAAMGIAVEVRDSRSNIVLGASTIDLAAQSAVTVQAPWTPAAPDSHEVQVRVSPDVLDESDFANNTASRVVVLGVPLSVGHDDAPTKLRFEPPYPNPTAQQVIFSFAVPRASAGSLDVYDILGRHVRGWRWAALVPGHHSVEWDGRGVSGDRLAPGVYLCRLRVGGEALQRKVILRP